MAIRVSSLTFMEIIVGLVAVVWAVSFLLDAVDPSWDGAQYNNIFMVVVGSGVFSSAISRRSKGSGDDG